ncbi:MAG: DUF4428 domain-containing protein [Symbiobacteriaceae bacterium]|nr:DUF4428 domain-containing protein [Symbiobacteriaceae bacterium]
MSFLGNLLERKNCDLCGEQLGRVFGTTNLSDGKICSKCAGLLSPYFTNRGKASLDHVRNHLNYREANKGLVSAFTPSRTLGTKMKVIIDDSAGTFIITSSGNWRSENPDVLSLAAVTDCNITVEEGKTELKTQNSEGKQVSYVPPRYKYNYDFTILIYVNSPWFSEIKFKLNSSTIEEKSSAEYREYDELAYQIRKALTSPHGTSMVTPAAPQVTQVIPAVPQVTQAFPAAPQVTQATPVAPAVAQICPSCGAMTTPDSNNRCEYCGSALSK